LNYEFDSCYLTYEFDSCLLGYEFDQSLPGFENGCLLGWNFENCLLGFENCDNILVGPGGKWVDATIDSSSFLVLASLHKLKYFDNSFL